MDKHQIDLYNQALKDYDEAIQKLERIKDITNLSIAHFDIDYLKQAINEILQIIDGVNQ